jgi:hypothetical protein
MTANARLGVAAFPKGACVRSSSRRVSAAESGVVGIGAVECITLTIAHRDPPRCVAAGRSSSFAGPSATTVARAAGGWRANERSAGRARVHDTSNHRTVGGTPLRTGGRGTAGSTGAVGLSAPANSLLPLMAANAQSSNAVLSRVRSLRDLIYHNTGFYNIDGAGAYPSPNHGAFNITQTREDMGAVQGVDASQHRSHDALHPRR